MERKIEPERIEKINGEEMLIVDMIDALPSPLRKICMMLYGMAFVIMALICMFFAAAGFSFKVLLIGLLLIIISLAAAVIKTKQFADGKYRLVDGTVIDSYVSGKFKWKVREILVATRENDTYSFSVSVGRRFRLLAGDRVAVYIPLGTQFYEKDGVTIISAYYGFERHR